MRTESVARARSELSPYRYRLPRISLRCTNKGRGPLGGSPAAVSEPMSPLILGTV